VVITIIIVIIVVTIIQFNKPKVVLKILKNDGIGKILDLRIQPKMTTEVYRETNNNSNNYIFLKNKG
jgi:hypothetical protein